MYSQTKIRILEEVLEPKRFTDLVRSIGISKKNLGIHLNRLEEMGLIVKGQDGKYALTEKGKDVLEALLRVDEVIKSSSHTVDESILKENGMTTNYSSTKIRILQACALGPKRLSEISSCVPISERNVIENLKRLIKDGFIEKTAEGKYIITEKGKDILEKMLNTEELNEAAELFADETVIREDFVEIKNLIPEEKRFYEFMGKLYIESLKLYGPPTLEFDTQLFRHIRKNVIRKAVPEVSEDELNSFRFQFLVVFNPSYAFDKIVREIEDSSLRDELMKYKKQILKDFLEKLYGIKVVER